MANYAFSFATVAAYRSAKNSGGTAEIYNALVPSSTTGSTVNVSRAAVSFIAELGRAVVDSVNVCVPYNQGGFVGDVLCYNATYGHFWMKSPRASWDANALGQTYYDSATFPSSFVRVGYCFHREGKHGLITEIGNGSGLAWSSDTSTQVAGIYTSTSIATGTRGVTWISGCKEAAEAKWGSEYYVYSWPIPRTIWDAAVAAAKAGTTGSGSAGSCSWSASAGVATITTTDVYGSYTVNPAAYDYNFDRWYRDNIEAIIPGPSGSITSMSPKDGINHDGVRNTRVLYGTGNSAAANRAVAYSVNAPSHGAGMWWIPTLVELVRLCKVYPELNKNGAGFTLSAYWSSDQYNASSAWDVNLNRGSVDASTKTYGYQVRLVSAFEIS